jgi:hypothetical protein
VATRGGLDSDRKTKVFPVMNRASDVCDQFSEKPRFGMGSFFFLDLFVRWCGSKKKKEKWIIEIFEMWKRKMDQRYS